MQGVDGQGYQTLDLNDCRLKADDASVAADFVGDTLKTTMERFALAGEAPQCCSTMCVGRATQ